jgi:hypothetical protein
METTNKIIEFTRVNNDINGNPRYVCHFFKFLTDEERNSYGIDNYKQLYQLAVKRANKIGGKKFHNKQYGGGIVFQMYSGEAEKMTQLINELKNN